MDDSPDKVERNSHKEGFHTMITRGKKRKAASDYDGKHTCVYGWGIAVPE